jgi:hypothetical protein
VIGQHPSHVQVLDDEPVVILDQCIGGLMQEVAPGVGDVMVMSRQLGGGIAAVV